MPNRTPKSKRRGGYSRKGGKSGGNWVTYPRCFLLTLGAIFFGVAAFAFLNEWDEIEHWEWSSYFALGFLLVIGGTLFGIGLFASNQTAEKWQEHSTSQRGYFLFVVFLAAPLYGILKFFERER